jgi:hypothetical protein
VSANPLRVFFLLLGSFLAVFVAGGAVARELPKFGHSQDIVQDLTMMLFTPITWIAMVLLYFDIRRHAEGASIQDLRDGIDAP